MDTLIRLQNWYKINCNGEWEHDAGLSLSTLDNPGWYLIVNLADTALEKLEYSRQYQSEKAEDDWFHFKAEKQNLIIACGPENLREVLLIFLDEIIPEFADPGMLYEIYLPLGGCSYKIWYPVKGKLISENTLELIEIPRIEYRNIMVKNLDLLDFKEEDMPDFTHDFKIGEQVAVELEHMFDSLKLVAVKQ